MAMRRIVFHWSDGTKTVEVLGFDFTILAAMRKYTSNDRILLNLHFKMNPEGQLQGMMNLGGDSVEQHLKIKMEVFLRNDPNASAGYSIEFI